MIANYHTHTYRCGHASGEERAYIEKAIEYGLTELGFADHAPMPLPDGLPELTATRLLNMRMKLHETEGYVNTLLSLREEYKNDIRIHIGFEVEYFENCFDAFMEHISPYPIDYLILGQHFGAMESDPFVHFATQLRSNALLTEYVDMAIKGIETDKMTYIAHPDMVFYTNKIETYEHEMTRLINCANAHKVPLEINLYGLQQVRNYPNQIFWQIASDIGCDVVLGLDAHRPENIINTMALKYAEKLVSTYPKLNLLETVTFKSLK